MAAQRAAGRAVAQVLAVVERRVRPGVTTAELDATARREIADLGATPLFLGLRHPQARVPFPAALCTSVNAEALHGVPGARRLVAGDLLKVDCGVRLSGFCAEAARTFVVGGQATAAAERLLAAANAAHAALLEALNAGIRWGVAARRLRQMVAASDFRLAWEFCGHGIGRELHERPHLAVDPGADDDVVLSAGTTLAIEPVLTAGDGRLAFADEQRWTIVTRDGALAAHVEDTVLIGAGGVEVLTDGR